MACDRARRSRGSSSSMHGSHRARVVVASIALMARIAILGCLVCAPWGVGAAEPTVSLGLHHSVALARDGTVLTWGDDHVGQLGLGRRIKSAMPLALGAL